MCSFGFAEEADESTNSFGFRKIGGGFWNCSTERSGGYGEFGWAFTDEDVKNFVLRDCFTVGGYGHNVIKSNIDFGELQVGNKFILGGVYDCKNFKVRSYGFVGTGIGIIGGTGVKFFKGAPMVEVNGGGGFEFQYSKNSAFVIEYGGRCEMPVGNKRASFTPYTNSSPLFTIGYRTLK